MSSYFRLTRHPETGRMEQALWIDDHFGRHRYGVRFQDGKVYPADAISEVEEPHGVGAETDPEQTTVRHWGGSQDYQAREPE